MKIFAPDYYSNFKCTAGKCSHSCCIGWEIDIDSDTYGIYQSVKTPFGEILRAGISSDGGVPHFVLDRDERCPFLNKGGLCDIIINLGEDSLCQICSDHPRFRNFFSDREEIGVGLCCEAAAKLIVNHEPKTVLQQIGTDDGTGNKVQDEQAFFTFRSRITDLLQNRADPFEVRINNIENLYGVKTGKTISQLAEIFKNLEYMENEWQEALSGLDMLSEDEIPDFTEYDTSFEQLAVYFIYRHLADGIYNGDFQARISFAVVSVRMIKYLCTAYMKKHGIMNKKIIADIARMYSSEIEYSEDNVQAILDILSNCG